MAPHAIVSYDDTRDDHDALMFGRLLHELGASLTLAYVRHAAQAHHASEELADHEAHHLLERGALTLDDPAVERRVVISPSTGEGLARLATETGADLIVFGPEYRTAAGHISIGRSAQILLQNGPAAIALAPAGFAAGGTVPKLSTIGVLPGTADEASIATAHSLARRFDAQVVDRARDIDLLIVGSRAEAREGRTMITSAAEIAIEEATAPVIITARDVALRFETLVTA
jgi:nucleotide-binding universal stress UspA family protein